MNTYTYRGVTGTVSELARLNNIEPYTLNTRLALGWSIEKAIETPLMHRLKKCNCGN